jgi:putative DNA primase/helicase
MTDQPQMLVAAQFWAGKGFPVFPLREGLKTPATGDGFKSATTDPHKIMQFFGGNSRHNIGLMCGGGLVVIDVDMKNALDGSATLDHLQVTVGALPDTLEVATPSGGKHLYYRYPVGVAISSKAGKIAGQPAPGLDIRADGGYVVCPPSVLDAAADPKEKTVSGAYAIVKKLPIADLPPAWLDLLSVKRDNPQPQRQQHHEPTSNSDKLAEIQDALLYVDSKPHDDWVRVGMALYSLGEDGLLLWDTWSKSAPNYDAAEIPKRWKSFAGSSVNLQTVFYMAAQNGWQNPAKGRKPEPHQRTNRTSQQQQGHHHRHSVEPDLDHVKLISGNAITPRQMEWAWQYWLPKGKLSLLVGAPKTGKTLLAIDLAATITSGGNFPDGTRADKSTVIFWTAEDDLDDTIVPRFKAAGGDLANVRFIDHTVSSGRGQPFNPSQDMPLLMDAIHRMDKPPALLIIDPVVSVTQDMNNALQVRMSLLPVVEMAQQHGMAVLGITHFRKSSGESGNIGERIIGSSAFLQVARMVWYAMKPPDMDSSRLFFKGDTNLAESDEGFLYEVESREAEFPVHRLTVQTAGIVWGDKLDAEALQAIIKPDGKNEAAPVQVEAEEFLKRFLATGARLKKEIDEEADNQGITGIALRRAKKSLGIQHRKRRGDSKSEWYFAELDQQLDQTHTPKKVDQVDQVDQVVEVEVFEV